jgi:hypothetical protein
MRSKNNKPQNLAERVGSWLNSVLCPKGFEYLSYVGNNSRTRYNTDPASCEVRSIVFRLDGLETFQAWRLLSDVKLG